MLGQNLSTYGTSSGMLNIDNSNVVSMMVPAAQGLMVPQMMSADSLLALQSQQAMQNYGTGLINPMAASMGTSLGSSLVIPMDSLQAAKHMPMQRDHTAIQRMQGGRGRGQDQATFAKRGKRGHGDWGSIPPKRSKPDEKSSPVIRDFRELLRRMVEQMRNNREGTEPFDESAAYELCRVKEDFKAMFGYTLDQKLLSANKMSEALTNHGLDIVDMRYTRARGAVLIPKGDSFVETGKVSENPNIGWEGKVAMKQAAAEARKAAAEAEAAAQGGDGNETVDTAEPIDQDGLQDPSDEPLPLVSEEDVKQEPDATAAAGPRPSTNDPASRAAEVKVTGTLSTLRRRVFAACFYLTKEVELLLRSSHKIEYLTPAEKGEDLEAALKHPEFAAAVAALQEKHSIQIGSLVDGISMNLEASAQHVHDLILNAASNQLRTAVTLDAEQTALVPIVGGFDAYQVVKDVLGLLVERLMAYTPSAVTNAKNKYGYRLDRLKPEFLIKYKYELEPSSFGFSGLKDFVQHEILAQYVVVVDAEQPHSKALKPAFDPLTDMRNFLEAQMLRWVNKQKDSGEYVLADDQGYKLNTLKRDFNLEYLYELNNIRLGFSSLLKMVGENADIVVLKEVKKMPTLLQPSPLFHLKLLLEESVKSVPSCHDEEGKKLEDFRAKEGYRVTEIMDDFKSVYGYELDLTQFSFISIGEVVRCMQDVCTVVTTPEKEMFLFPPRPGAYSQFLKILRSKASKDVALSSKDRTPAYGSQPGGRDSRHSAVSTRDDRDRGKNSRKHTSGSAAGSYRQDRSSRRSSGQNDGHTSSQWGNNPRTARLPGNQDLGLVAGVGLQNQGPMLGSNVGLHVGYDGMLTGGSNLLGGAAVMGGVGGMGGMGLGLVGGGLGAVSMGQLGGAGYGMESMAAGRQGYGQSGLGTGQAQGRGGSNADDVGNASLGQPVDISSGLRNHGVIGGPVISQNDNNASSQGHGQQSGMAGGQSARSKSSYGVAANAVAAQGGLGHKPKAQGTLSMYQQLYSQQGGQSYHDVQGGQSYRDVQGGQSYRDVQGGQPYRDVQGGQSYRDVQGAQPYRDVQGGQSYRDVQGGQTYRDVQGGQTYRDVQGGQTGAAKSTYGAVGLSSTAGMSDTMTASGGYGLGLGSGAAGLGSGMGLGGMSGGLGLSSSTIHHQQYDYSSAGMGMGMGSQAGSQVGGNREAIGAVPYSGYGLGADAQGYGVGMQSAAYKTSMTPRMSGYGGQ